MNILNAAIEGSSLYGQMTGEGIYTYNLIKYLSIIEKKDRFYILHSNSSLFKKNNIDFKQHNIIHHRQYALFSSKPQTDIYHDTTGISPARDIKGKKIITIHDLSPIVMPQLYEKSEAQSFELRIKANISSCYSIIVPSENTKKDLINLFKIDPNKINIINEGSDDCFKPQQKYDIELTKARYSIKRPYILFAGALEKRKNIKNILKAFSTLKYESPPDLIFIGKENKFGEPLIKTAKEYGVENSMKYLGYIDRKSLPCLMSGAELFLWPSFYEGFGLPILEAMSCGAPIISSNTSSIPEVVGSAGILIDPNDAEAITNAIRRILNDKSLQEFLKKKSIEQAKLFSLKTMAVKTLELYRKTAQ